jgi:putative transposase
MDLRERVVDAVERGGLSRRRAAARFGVGISTVIAWVQLYRETGSVAPGKMGGHRPRKLIGAWRDWLLERCRERDFTLRAWLEHHGLPHVVAANKVDALGRGEATRRVGALARGVGQGARRVVGVSAERGAGLDELWNEIRGAAFEPAGEGAGAPAGRGNDGR